MNKLKNAYYSRINKMRYAPTEDLINKINNTEWETLADWHQELNKWRWPKELYPVIECKKEWQPNQRRSQLMGLIKDKVGGKYLLYRWNVYQKKPSPMTESEFEEWWNTRFTN